MVECDIVPTVTARPPASCPPVVLAGAPDLDPAQRRVVEHPRGPLLVLAGPGTGKTTTLVESVAARVARGTPVDRILALTFSRRAALELRHRIARRLGPVAAAPTAFTFHAFCYALLRQWSPPQDYAEPFRLLSVPEQDVMIRELVAGAVADDRGAWPEQLSAALRTRGFAAELRALLARMRELGLDPEQLTALGRTTGRPQWVAAGRFAAGYLDVLDAQGALDYPELVHRTVVLASRPDVLADLRQRFPVVFVDEYQDTDPAQERLLQLLAGDGGDLVVFGDPDQSIYAFRGADVGNLLAFPDRFRQPDGRPADVLALDRSRRAGEVLLAASRRVARRLPVPGLPVAQVQMHRELVPRPGDPGRVEVFVYPNLGAEADGIADLLRRAHLLDGWPWSSMAVLVRSAVRSVPLLRRALVAAGVPVEVAGDELPLAREPAARLLLLALQVAADPAGPTAEQAQQLLISPLTGEDAIGLRRLRRWLRGQHADLATVLRRPDLLAGVPPRLATPTRRLADLIAAARRRLTAGDPAELALWELWNGTDWPARLSAFSAAGGSAGRSADRDLDAVVALFDWFARAEERRPGRGVTNLLAELAAQEIPADPPAGPAGTRDAVRLTTAHRAKGLEWDLVVLAQVQEDSWPDLRRRGSLLAAEQLGRDDPVDPGRTAALVEERRLFYVATTRARHRLVVTAVESAEEGGVRPSRFLAELGAELTALADDGGRSLSPTGLVAELRRVATDPAAGAELRTAAVHRLARLTVGPNGRALVRAASPDSWWGLPARTAADRPLRDPAAPLTLSATSVRDAEECPLRWFLRHEARAERPAGLATVVGSLLHAVVERVADGRLPADPRQLADPLDRVLGELPHHGRWQADVTRREALDALGRFLAWQDADRGRGLLGVEVPFAVTLPVGDRQVVIRGTVDRLEIDDDGAVCVVDFKSGRTPPTQARVNGDLQLGCYQLAVRHDAFADTPGIPEPAPPGGAELVWLRVGRAGGLPRVQRQQPTVVDDDELHDTLAGVVAALTDEQFPARPGEHCTWCAYRICCPAQPEGAAVVP
jgi:superfamily I DNA/RNA helicase/RecB family exonuclease